jgi:hypothetical protein
MFDWLATKGPDWPRVTSAKAKTPFVGLACVAAVPVSDKDGSILALAIQTVAKAV